MIKQLPLYRIISWVILVMLTILIVVIGMKSTNAQSSVIPASLAVDRALTYALEDGQIGGMTTKPTDVRGQVMTYGQAVQLIFGKPIGSNDAVAKIRDYPVWLVILQGEFIEHVPSSADGSIPSKDILHTQMAIILDGNTGEIIERIMISPQKTLSVGSLPVLTESSDSLPAFPTKGPISTEVPYPTLNP